MKHYDKSRDPIALGQHFLNHMEAMTAEDLYSKADIAQELAARDQRIEELESELRSYANWDGYGLCPCCGVCA